MRRYLTAVLACALAANIHCAARAETGANSYLLECQGCHARDGRGAIATVPSLQGEMAKFLLVEGGREFLVQVPGSAQSPLSDEELAETLNWMLGQFGPAGIARRYAPYTAAEVAALRLRPLVDIDATRAALIDAIATASE